MRVMWASTVHLIFMLQTAFSAVFQGVITGDSAARPNMCHYRVGDSTIYFKEGSISYDDGACIKYSCYRTRDGRLLISGVTCGVALVEPPCTFTRQTGGHYPECCPKPSCPDDYHYRSNNKEN